MRIFVYKTLFVSVCFLVLFQLTIGAKTRQLSHQIEKLKSKQNIEIIKSKIRDELRSAIEKDSYLTPEDAKLINQFINKLKNEFSN